MGLAARLRWCYWTNPPTHQRHTKRATLAVWEFPLPLLVPQTGPEEVPAATWCGPRHQWGLLLFFAFKRPRSNPIKLLGRCGWWPILDEGSPQVRECRPTPCCSGVRVARVGSHAADLSSAQDLKSEDALSPYPGHPIRQVGERSALI